MARISTYQHDAMPHADDNVIGTNQSPGHANETVLFRIGAIEELIRSNLLHVQSFTRSDYDNRFYDDLSNLIPADTGTTSPPDPSTATPIPDAAINVTHNLNSQNVVVFLSLTLHPVTRSDSGVISLDEAGMNLGQVQHDNETNGYTVETVDNNTVRIVFDQSAVYSGTIIVMG